MGFLDNVGGFFKDAGNGIAHAAGDGYKAASDAWNTVFEDAKASANVVGTAVRDADAKKEQIGYDPSAFGKKLEADVTTAEKALLLEDRNVGTSLVNTAIATTATVARGFLSILQVGTGAAQGVEDIRRGFSESGDAWDVAIGASRLLSDAGEIASASLTVAGAATKVAQTSRGKGDSRARYRLACLAYEQATAPLRSAALFRIPAVQRFLQWHCRSVDEPRN